MDHNKNGNISHNINVNTTTPIPTTYSVRPSEVPRASNCPRQLLWYVLFRASLAIAHVASLLVHIDNHFFTFAPHRHFFRRRGRHPVTYIFSVSQGYMEWKKCCRVYSQNLLGSTGIHLLVYIRSFIASTGANFLGLFEC